VLRLRQLGIDLAAALCFTAALEPSAASAEPARAAETADEGVQRKAKALATEAKFLFQQKAFVQAGVCFMEAYTLVKEPTLVFNAARSYEEAKDADKAIALYRAYLGHADIDAGGRADAEVRIARLQEAIAHGRAAAEREAAARDARAKEVKERDQKDRERKEREGIERSRRDQAERAEAERAAAERAKAAEAARKRPFPTVAAVTTAGLAVTGGALYALAVVEAGDARELEPSLKTDDDRAAYFGHVDRATSLRNAAIAASVLGTGCAAWLLWELTTDPAPAPPPRTTTVRPVAASRPAPAWWVVGPTANGLAIRGGF